MDAYDYDRQAWVTGQDGARLRAAQLAEVIGLLESHRGARYLAMTHKAGRPRITVSEALRAARADLVQAQAAAVCS